MKEGGATIVVMGVEIGLCFLLSVERAIGFRRMGCIVDTNLQDHKSLPRSLGAYFIDWLNVWFHMPSVEHNGTEGEFCLISMERADRLP